MKIELIIASVCLLVQTSCNISENDYPNSKSWKTDFFDDFNHLDKNNWQEQKIWVNNEIQCYVDSGRFNTLEVSDGTLKLRVVKIDSIMPCDNHDKFGNQHPATNIVSSRICTKNKKEFIKGRWTARLKLKSNGMPSQFPAWWILGAQNNEAPVQEENENICWPLQGSGEIDIFEHHGDHMKDAFTTGRIVSLGDCDKGDWWSQRINVESRLSDFHEYSVEWTDHDLVYRLDGEEVFRNVGAGDKYTEPMFAILNYAKITENEMQGSWEMEVDWVKHEKQNH